METLYLISLLVGGFFVALSLFGGGDADADLDADFDVDVEADYTVDAGANSDAPTFATAPGWVDLLSVRTLFLFAAFFGLTGTVLSMVGTGEPATAIYSLLLGSIVGVGGNYVIERVGRAHVSSTVSSNDFNGSTAEVVIPFEGAQRGKISLVTRGHRMQIVAQAFEQIGAFLPGDEVVVVRMRGSIAEVVKPD